MVGKIFNAEQLHGHIFYQNSRDNLGYEYQGYTPGNPPPKRHKATKPCRSIDELRPLFDGKPCFVVGSGPSLDKNIATFAAGYRPSMGPILACDGSIHDLAEHGLKPTFVTSAEADGQHNRPIIPTTDILLIDKDLGFYQDVPLIACTWLNANFNKLWPCPTRFWYKNGDPRYEYFWRHHHELFPEGIDLPLLTPRTSTIGFHSIEIARHLGASEVILLGFDFSVPSKDRHHSKRFNVSWEKTDTDLIKCYSDHFMWFMDNFDCKFDMAVTNCTEGGILTADRTDATCKPLADRLKEFI